MRKARRICKRFVEIIPEKYRTVVDKIDENIYSYAYNDK
jgi:hypothetical protein